MRQVPCEGKGWCFMPGNKLPFFFSCLNLCKHGPSQVGVGTARLGMARHGTACWAPARRRLHVALGFALRTENCKEENGLTVRIARGTAFPVRFAHAASLARCQGPVAVQGTLRPPRFMGKFD